MKTLRSVRHTNHHRWRFSRAIYFYQADKIHLVSKYLFVFDLKEGEGARIRMQPIGSRR